MSNAFLIIGVGGAGRGVCNHIKYELEKEFGDPDRARTKILVIDGPPSPSQYVLPGNYDMDTGPQSPEFAQTSLTPDPAISRIAQGNPTTADKYIAEWLPKEEAAKIPTPINPTSGFGGHRSPGHAYFCLDVNNIQQRIQTAYAGTRIILGGHTGEGNQVYVFLIGSQSGGTGSGLLWDVAHLVHKLILPNQDLLFGFLPLANSFHALFSSSEEVKKDSDAKNHAGLLNLMRFMHADPTFRTTIKYSNAITVHNPALFHIPFLLDGDVNNARLNDIEPQKGVVPAMADFILTIIKDNISTAQIFGDLINWRNYIGNAPKAEKYATFGVYSIRYPYREVLESFSYKFAYEIYNDILSPLGDSVNQGQTLATRILNSTVFTQMIANFGTITIKPEDYKVLRDKIKVGKVGDPVIPKFQPLTEVIPYGGVWPFKKKDEDVTNKAENHMNTIRTKTRDWLNKARAKIVESFISEVERELLDLFTKVEEGKRIPRTLRESPSSIVIARDFLAYLKDKIESSKKGSAETVGFESYILEEFNKYYYPNGQHKADLIANQITRVNEKKGKLRDNDGEKQEEYLKEAKKLLDLEVWDLQVKGIQSISADLKTGILNLWKLIGDDAHGWVSNLTAFQEMMEEKYGADITRRNEFQQLRLREYLPRPDSKPEDVLFDELAEPEIKNLLDRIHWNFAIEPAKPERYTILLNSPKVEGFDYGKSDVKLIDPFTGKPLEIYRYSPYEHVQYAKNNLEEALNGKTIWDIMELDFEAWLEDKGEKDKKKREEYEDRYVTQWVNRLIAGSSPLHNSNGNPAHLRAFDFSDFRIADKPDTLATKFYQMLNERRITGEIMQSHPTLSKEIRRSVACLELPLTNWNYYSTSLGSYMGYCQDNSKVLVNIYRNEQNAFHLEDLIREKLVRDFTLLDFSVTQHLYDLDVFRSFALCYLMDLIPKKAGKTITDPKLFYLEFPNGSVDLAQDGDIEGLYYQINRIAYTTDAGLLKDNDEVQDKIISIWKEKESAAASSSQLNDLVEEIDKKLKTIDCLFPDLPASASAEKKQERAHLKLAVRAIILEYMDKLRKFSV